MDEVIAKNFRKARKPHKCDYCGEMINPGEVYERTTIKRDVIYDWVNHVRCGEIAAEIWDYADPDPDYGMTGDDFREFSQDVCRTFICPDCEHWDENEGCIKGETFCTQRMADFFKTHDLVRDRSAGNLYTWKCVESRKDRAE